MSPNCSAIAKQLETEEAARSLALAAQSAQADLAQATTLLAYYQSQAPPVPALGDEPMLEHQLPFQDGSTHRTAAAAAMPLAHSVSGSATPILEVPPAPPFLPPAPPHAPVLEQPYITSLTAAMQSNAESMAREVANIKASFEAQTLAMKESVGTIVSQLQAGQLVPAANSSARAAPGGAAPSAAGSVHTSPLFKFGFTAKPASAAPPAQSASPGDAPPVAAASSDGSNDALPPASRSARQTGWALSDAAGAPVSMASAMPNSAPTRGRSAAPARGGSGRDLAGIREESHGGSPRPPRRRTTSPRRPSGLPHDGHMEDDPRRAHEVPVPTEVNDPLDAELAGRSVADAMAADEAAALASEAAAHQAQDAHNDLAQAAMHGTVFQVAPPSTAPE